ncbi:MAG TPA: GNAT family N-acetyltransferase [Actinomycetota bacterium]|nr:GNAT family N-acetyltransferase [Actinomycetota bacterium]
MTEDLFARAVGFEHWMQEHAAERIEPFAWGRAVFNDTFHRVYDLNALRVETPEPGLTADALAAEADRLHVPAGHQHRRVVVPDAALGERLGPGFRRLGWEVRRFLFMGLLREPDDGTPRAPVRELAEAEHWEAKRWFMAGAPEAFDDLVVTQLLEKDRLKERFVDFRRFGVEADGRVVSVCELYSDGSTAQVEDVSTQEPYRGRGYARATVLTAVGAARDAGCDFVFLVADEDDWPRELYRKLGFDPLGIVYDFLKLPPGEKLPP